MITILDVETNRKKTIKGLSVWALTEGNWSCDCNRARYFDAEDELEQRYGYGNCFGSRRFFVIEPRELAGA